MKKSTNPLMNLKLPDKDFIIPFDKIKAKHFIPAARYWKKVTDQRIKNLKKVSDPSFESVFMALETHSLEIDLIVSILSVYNSVLKTPRIEKIAKVVNALEQKAGEWIYDLEIYEKVKAAATKNESLRPHEERFVKDVLEGFTKNGVLLPKSKQKRLKEINKNALKLEMNFSSKVLRGSEYTVHATKDEVEGIPQDTLKAARVKAKKQKKTGYLFGEPQEVEVLKFAKNRDLRRRLFIKGRQVGIVSHKTEKNILGLVKLRKELAKILGNQDYPEFVLEDRMVKNLSNLSSILTQVYKMANAKAKEELNQLKSLALEKDGITDFARYDEMYYANQVIESSLSVDMQKVKEYFPLTKVWGGLREVIKTFFGVTIKEVKYPLYHKDAKAYELTDASGEKIGTLIMDLFQRPKKEDNAWMSDIVPKAFDNKPTALVVMNLNKTERDLMDFEEVKAIFHELGHALHVLCSKNYLPSLSAMDVEWDFVELPSQFLEMWVQNEDVINMISGHYQTNETLPVETVQKIQKINGFFPGLNYINYLFHAVMDLELHSGKKITNILKFEKELYNRLQPYKYIEGTSRLAAFSHIIDGGYEVGYYAYLYADILTKDAYLICSQTGGIKSPYLTKFKALMERASEMDELENYKLFKGSEPNIEALFVLEGLKDPDTQVKRLIDAIYPSVTHASE